MKKLCLFRHAKSTYASLGTDDLDRPLHEVGLVNAPLMANVLLDKYGFKPDLIVTSHAKRALETANLVAEVLNYTNDKIKVVEQLYEAGVEDLIHEIDNFDNNINTILMIGHNPGMTLLANFLSDQHINNLPTCGVVGLEFKTKAWNDIAEADTKILFIDEPKNHQ